MYVHVKCVKERVKERERESVCVWGGGGGGGGGITIKLVSIYYRQHVLWTKCTWHNIPNACM